MNNEICIPSPPSQQLPSSSSSRRGRVVAHIKQKLLAATATSLFSSSSSSSLPSANPSSLSSSCDDADSSPRNVLTTQQQEQQEQQEHCDDEKSSSSSHSNNENNPSVLNTKTTDITTSTLTTTSTYSITADIKKANLSQSCQGEIGASDASGTNATIRYGTVCRLFIDKYTEEEFWDILDALNSNHVVQKIVIFRSKEVEVEADENDDDQNQNIGSSSKEPQQQRRRPSDDVDYLFHVIRSLRTLTELNMWNLTNDDLASLSLGLVDHPSIVYLQLHMIKGGTLDETVGKAITTMPRLVSLEVEVAKSFPLWPFATSSQSLSVLSVVSSRFKWESRHVLQFADRLERNGGDVLTVLDLEPEMTCECLCAMISSIRSSSSSSSSSSVSTNRDEEGYVSRLETFQFNCQTEDKAEGDELCEELSKLVDSNKHHLRVVWNHRYESLAINNEMSEPTILKSIESSSSIEQFHVFVEHHEFSSQKEKLLKANIDKKKYE